MTGAKVQQFGCGSKGIRKTYGNSKIAKNKSRLSTDGGDKKWSSGSTQNSFIPKRKSISLNGSKASKQAPKQYTNVNNPVSSKSGPVFKEVVPLQKRKVFENLSNSPVLSQKINVKQSTVAKPNPSIKQEDIQFEADPTALASILNNEGVTTDLLKQNALNEGRPSMVANNTFLFPDGRPSLCRRVPIQRAKPKQDQRRATLCGPRRVLSSTKKGPSAPRYSLGQRNSMLPSNTGQNSRHSLYSVVQGRYSNADSGSRNQKIQSGSKTNPPVNKPEKQNEYLNLPYKSPPAVRVQSREVRISASPALRIKKPLHVTPLPQRSAKKTFQRGVKWADEKSPSLKDNLVTHLFQNDSPLSTPMTANKTVKTPVSILKNRKHFKRNSLTPPMLKKDKKNKDDEAVEEIVKPQVLNDWEGESNNNEQSEEKLVDSQPENATKTQPKIKSPGISAKKTFERQAKVLRKDSPILKEFSPELDQTMSAITKEKRQDDAPDVVEVEKIFKIMNLHLTKVKRRSVQAEFSNVMSKISASLQSNGLQEESILEVDEPKENQLLNINERTEIHKEISKPINAEAIKNPLTKTSSFFPLTPGTIKDIRENGDEQCKKDFDQILLETERINEEMKKLKLEKERLISFQEKVKKSRAQQRTIINVPDLVPADALPSFSQAQRTRAEAKEGINVVYDLSPSWDKVLKSDMKVSPGTLTSDVISQSLTSNNDMTSRSLDTSGVTPVKEANCGMEFVKTASPHISALSLEKTKHADQPIPDIRSNSNPFSSQKPSSFTLSSLAKHIPKKQTGSMFTRVKLEPEVSQNPTLVKQGNIPTVANELKEAKKDTPSAMTSKGFLSPATKMTTPQPDSNLDFSFLKHLPPPSLLKNATGKSSTSSVSFPVSTISTASPNSSSDLSSHAFTETTSSSPYCSSTKSTSTTSSNLMRIKEALEKPISLQFSSPTLSEDSQRRFPLPTKTPAMRAPDPIFPLPYQTPAAFRTLRSLRNTSPAKPIAAMKQQFAQVLLDEEVSLLTCKTVRPNDVLQLNKNRDPVAHSLSHGDDQHFVPIIKTPSATPVRNRRSSFGDSAFAKYLRM